MMKWLVTNNNNKNTIQEKKANDFVIELTDDPLATIVQVNDKRHKKTYSVRRYNLFPP